MARGPSWSWEHQQIRRAMVVALDGRIPTCAYDCGDPMPPNPRLWDLAHAADGVGYMGFAHQRCNRADGARVGNRRRATRVYPSRFGELSVPGATEVRRVRRRRRIIVADIDP